MNASSRAGGPARRARPLLARVRRRLGVGPGSEAVARSAKVARLEARIAELEQAARNQTRLRYQMAPTPVAGVGRASWQAYVRRGRRMYYRVSRLPDREVLPHWSLPHKLETYRVALSHGVRIPTVYAVWQTLEEIDLTRLPETFVLKSAGGSTSRGVFPVRRDGAGYVQVDGSRTFTAAELVEALARLAEQGKSRSPYFAEELVQDHSGSALPHDVKLFCYYGEVGQVLIRDVPVHGEDASLRKRYVRPDGTDLTEEVTEVQDPSLPLPPHFEELLRVGERLSLAVPLPFVRVDLYDTPHGVTMGELTLVPGGRQAWTLEHDTFLGRMVEAAEVRLWRDLATGRPFRTLYGEHPHEIVPVVGGPV
jgi:hypothetical protein